MEGDDIFLASYILLWAVAIVLVPVAIILLYHYSLIQRLQDHQNSHSPSRERLKVGGACPDYVAVDVFSGIARRGGEWAGSSHTVLALSLDCMSCKLLLADMTSKSESELINLGLIILCVGPVGSCRKAFSPLQSVIPILAADSTEASILPFARHGLPVAIAINDRGRIALVENPKSMADLSHMWSELGSSESADSVRRDILATIAK